MYDDRRSNGSSHHGSSHHGSASSPSLGRLNSLLHHQDKPTATLAATGNGNSSSHASASGEWWGHGHGRGGGREDDSSQLADNDGKALGAGHHHHHQGSASGFAATTVGDGSGGGVVQQTAWRFDVGGGGGTPCNAPDGGAAPQAQQALSLGPQGGGPAWHFDDARTATISPASAAPSSGPAGADGGAWRFDVVPATDAHTSGGGAAAVAATAGARGGGAAAPHAAVAPGRGTPGAMSPSAWLGRSQGQGQGYHAERRTHGSDLYRNAALGGGLGYGSHHMHHRLPLGPVAE